MKVMIEHGGGYQDTTLHVDALPRVGETVRIGDWEGEVIKVTHLPSQNASGRRYRADDEPSAWLVLAGSHQVKTPRSRPDLLVAKCGQVAACRG